MLRIAALVIVVGIVGCKKEDKAKPADPKPAVATQTAGTVENGVRKIPVEANNDGYKPDKIIGKPGEKLDLVFTRTSEADCISQLVTPDKQTVALPLNKPVDVNITVPASGQLAFACGMDMFHGSIVAQP
ncbi:MAG TPA: cupredoxin domain-containing protein [Kofleriaceae bacterium]